MLGLLIREGIDMRAHVGQPVRRELAGAVLVHMDDVTGEDFHTCHRDRHVERPERKAAVAGRHPAGDVLQAERANLVHITHRAVGEKTDRSTRLEQGT